MQMTTSKRIIWSKKILMKFQDFVLSVVHNKMLLPTHKYLRSEKLSNAPSHPFWVHKKKKITEA